MFKNENCIEMLTEDELCELFPANLGYVNSITNLNTDYVEICIDTMGIPHLKRFLKENSFVVDEFSNFVAIVHFEQDTDILNDIHYVVYTGSTQYVVDTEVPLLHSEVKEIVQYALGCVKHQREISKIFKLADEMEKDDIEFQRDIDTYDKFIKETDIYIENLEKEIAIDRIDYLKTQLEESLDTILGLTSPLSPLVHVDNLDKKTLENVLDGYDVAIGKVRKLIVNS